MEIWSDLNRYSQTGYSSPTTFPNAFAYRDLSLFLDDTHLAVQREVSRRDWLEEQQGEARQEYLEYQAEIKAQREEDF